jgi:hypothetical protein
MITLSHNGGHSAKVKMQLLLNGHSIAINQMGRDFLFVKSPIDHPPATGTLVLQVDNSERRWQVYLPDGLSAKSDRVAIAKSDSVIKGD